MSACVCVMSHCETTLSPPPSFFHFFASHLTVTVIETVCVCVCLCMRMSESQCKKKKKSTQGLSKWFKRDVRGLQHMVGSDFLMQIGKDQIKAA